MTRRRKLLLADDSTAIQKVVSLTFSDEGFDVVTTGSGDAAARELEENPPPDIVLADIFMPGLNGYEVCRRVKQDQRLQHIPVLLLVGTFEPFNETEARRVGADGIVTKPFQSIRDLVSKVGSLLGGGRDEKEATTRDLVPPSGSQPAAQNFAAPSPEGVARDSASDAAQSASPLPWSEPSVTLSDGDAGAEGGRELPVAESAAEVSFADLGMDDQMIEERPLDQTDDEAPLHVLLPDNQDEEDEDAQERDRAAYMGLSTYEKAADASASDSEAISPAATETHTATDAHAATDMHAGAASVASQETTDFHSSREEAPSYASGEEAPFHASHEEASSPASREEAAFAVSPEATADEDEEVTLVNFPSPFSQTPTIMHEPETHTAAAQATAATTSPTGATSAGAQATAAPRANTFAADDALLDLGSIEPTPADESDDFILDLDDIAPPRQPSVAAPQATAAAPAAARDFAPQFDTTHAVGATRREATAESSSAPTGESSGAVMGESSGAAMGEIYGAATAEASGVAATEAHEAGAPSAQGGAALGLPAQGVSEIDAEGAFAEAAHGESYADRQADPYGAGAASYDDITEEMPTIVASSTSAAVSEHAAPEAWYAEPDGEQREPASSHGLTESGVAQQSAVSDFREQPSNSSAEATGGLQAAGSPTYQEHDASAYPAPQSGGAQAGAGQQIGLEQLSPEVIDAIARRVVEQLSDRVVREIAWDVVPELAELLIKKRLEEQH